MTTTTRRRPRRSRALLFLFFGSVAAAACDDCRDRIPVESVPEKPYPSCGDGPLPEGELIGSGHLRPGPAMRDQKAVVERFEIRKRDCLYVVTVRQEWSLGTSDVEVIYDEALRPLRAWKRMLLPAAEDPVEEADIRLYELRNDPPTLAWRRPSGELEYRVLKGGQPEAVVGPGRGILSMWIRAARLEPGEKQRVPVLDFRKDVENVEPVTLMREQDQDEPGLGGRVRVYTVFGRETVFTDDRGIVVGDLRGLRPDESLDTPPPEPLPPVPPPDPVHTP
ncbi:MAG: hypothetical protein ACOCXM_02460 [Myxococcota bacterium]